jgi:hypothetical protein
MWRFARAVLGLLAAVVTTGCVTPQIDPDDAGHVSGTLMVFWVGEDNFVYYPLYKTDPLRYRLPKRLAQELGYDEIRPGIIYTDGGSIPPAVRGWAGFSPWGYGPAYIVHDWLFIAHHCIVLDRTEQHDPRDRGEVEKVRKVDFQASADILAAVIQALGKQGKVPTRNFAPKAIYTAVDSTIAENLWDTHKPEACSPPTHDEVVSIERKLRGVRPFAAPGVAPAGPEPVLVYQQSF